MTEPRRLTEEERADLVAYLDGELDENAARAVEAKIQSDPNARTEAESLKRAWDLLDYLPSRQSSPSFTHRTIERVSPLRPKSKSAASPSAGRGWRRPWVIGAGWAAAVLVAGAVGFAVTARFAPPREPTDEELIRDLHVIERRKAYEQVDDIDFLRQLDDPDLFGDEPDS
jgi:anti-sigma factor RsiW